VQVAVFAARSGAYGEDALGVHGELRGRPTQLLFLVGVALALPGNQDSALVQQRRRQLGEG
jgi:hypothetical protein